MDNLWPSTLVHAHRCFSSAAECTPGKRPRRSSSTASSTSSSDGTTLVLMPSVTCSCSSSSPCSTRTASSVGTTGENCSLWTSFGNSWKKKALKYAFASALLIACKCSMNHLNMNAPLPLYSNVVMKDSIISATDVMYFHAVLTLLLLLLLPDWLCRK